MTASLSLLATALRLSASTAPLVCATTVNTRGAHLFLEMVKPAVADTVIRVRLCLVPPKAGIGSYSATLTFDSTTMRAARVDVSGGMQAANANVAGSVRLAGAAPNGFQPGLLATIVFRPKRGKRLSKIRLTLLEANTPSGASVLADSKVAGYPSADRTLGVLQRAQVSAAYTATGPKTRMSDVPRIDSISPPSGHIEPEGVLDLVIYGRGFASEGNRVLFDAATVDGLTSENGGTVIRFMAPTMIPEHGKVQARRISPGKYDVKVRTPTGSSNAVTFKVRGDDR